MPGMKPPRGFEDPARQLERMQEQMQRRSCSGCAHWMRLWDVVVCRKHEGRTGNNVQTCNDFVKKKDSRFRLHPFLQTKTGGFVLVKLTKGA